MTPEVAAAVACTGCGAPVIASDLLAGPVGHVARHEVLVDPAPRIPAPDLLLHLGRSADTGRWLFVPLDDCAGRTCAERMPLPHAHQQHVCATVPAGWAATDTAQPGAATGSAA